MASDFDIENPPPQDLENQTGLHDADEDVNLCMMRLHHDVLEARESNDTSCNSLISELSRSSKFFQISWEIDNDRRRPITQNIHSVLQRDALPDVTYYYNSSGESLTANFDPASHRCLRCPAGDFWQDAFSLNQRNATTMNLPPASCRNLSHSDGNLNSESPTNATSIFGYNSPTEAIVAQFYPPSGRRLPYLDGRFHRQARSLNYIYAGISNPRFVYNSFVNNLNIIQLFVNNRSVEGPRLTETFLSITSQAALAMLTIWTSNDTRLTHTATILFYIAAALNVFGFLSCLFAILIRVRNPQIARIVTGTGFVSAAYGFLAIMTMLLNDNIRLWVAGLACLACIPALALAFIA